MSGIKTGRNKTNEYKLNAIKNLLDEYVAKGGNIDDITSKK